MGNVKVVLHPAIEIALNESKGPINEVISGSLTFLSLAYKLYHGNLCSSVSTLPSKLFKGNGLRKSAWLGVETEINILLPRL
jgi:hypothetical protein